MSLNRNELLYEKGERDMKRILNCILALTLVIGFFPTVYANECNEEHEITESTLDINTVYEIINDTVVELTTFEYDDNLIEMEKTAYQNNYVEIVIKENNIIKSQRTVYSPDIYVELLSRVPSPISVMSSREDLPITLYKHYFVSSNTETLYEEEIDEFLMAGVALVLSFVAYKFPALLSADQASLATGIFNLLAAATNKVAKQMIITNIYEVKLKSDLSYYGLCYHINVINFEEEDKDNAAEEGMYYYQVL